MIIKLDNVKLKHKLMLIIGTSIAIIILIQILFFFSFSYLTKKRAQVNFSSLVQQIEGRINSITKDIERSSHTMVYSKLIQQYLTETNATERVKLYPYVSNALTNEVILNNYTWDTPRYIQNIKIIDASGNEISFYIDELFDISKKISKDYNIKTEKFKTVFYTHNYYDSEKQKSYFAYIEPIISLLPYKVAESNIGTSTYLCSTETFQQIIDSASLQENAVLFLSKENNVIFASNKKDYIGKTLSIGSSDQVINEEENIITYNKQDCLYKSIKLAKTNWNMVLLIPVGELIKDMEFISKLGIIVGIAATVILLLIGIIFTSSIYSQISKIWQGMKKVGSSSLNYRLEPTIREELECIRKYFNIISIRHGERFTLHTNIGTDTLDKKIVKMILQPLVENAIFHGLEKKNGSGTLTITAVLENVHIAILIEDTGVGMNEIQLASLRDFLRHENTFSSHAAKENIGILNIFNKLKLYYGENFDFFIESTLNSGTKMTISIPDEG